MFLKLTKFDTIFWVIVSIFIIAMAFTLAHRDGRDLKVGLFGVEQVLQKKSPYENPSDPNRTIFRYAPGITILEYPFLFKAKMVNPSNLDFENIKPSVFAWYFFELLALCFSAKLLLKLIPSSSRGTAIRNLKIGILLALPLIGYELSNSQNKLPALFFLLIAFMLFKKRQWLLSAIVFSIAITVYVPLAFFVLYFLIKSKGRYIIHFLLGAIIIFFIIPSLFFGIEFNLYLLKEWFRLSIAPFSVTTSYASYVDLRVSSQSLPSAIGRIFVTGKTGDFKYLISPQAVHIIIRVFSYLMLLFSCIAVFRARKNEKLDGLAIGVFLILALVMPQYCIYYTWAYLFVIYFIVFNYLGYPEASPLRKRALIISISILFLSICLIGVHFFKYYSAIFWATFILWAKMVFLMIFSARMSRIVTDANG
ncbi:MAG: glycosyltransferase 87 family protein [Candidatus Omnitrophota bacterium]|jgi:hypothetical protein